MTEFKYTKAEGYTKDFTGGIQLEIAYQLKRIADVLESNEID